MGQRGHVALAVHLPQSAQSGLLPSQTIQGSECSFRDGPPPKPLLPVGCGPVTFPGSCVLRVIYRHAERSALLTWRESRFLDGASLTILLPRHVNMGSLPLVVRIPMKVLSLGTDQVVAVVDEVALEHHAGMNRDVSRDVPFLKQSSQAPLAVAVSPASETGCNSSPSSKSGAALDTLSKAWVTPLAKLNPPKSTMTLSWQC